MLQQVLVTLAYNIAMGLKSSMYLCKIKQSLVEIFQPHQPFSIHVINVHFCLVLLHLIATLNLPSMEICYSNVRRRLDCLCIDRKVRDFQRRVSSNSVISKLVNASVVFVSVILQLGIKSLMLMQYSFLTFMWYWLPSRSHDNSPEENVHAWY